MDNVNSSTNSRASDLSVIREIPLQPRSTSSSAAAIGDHSLRDILSTAFCMDNQSAPHSLGIHSKNPPILYKVCSCSMCGFFLCLQSLKDPTILSLLKTIQISMDYPEIHICLEIHPSIRCH